MSFSFCIPLRFECGPLFRGLFLIGFAHDVPHLWPQVPRASCLLDFGQPTFHPVPPLGCWWSQDLENGLAKPLTGELSSPIFGPKVLDFVLICAVNVSSGSSHYVYVLQWYWESSFIRNVKLSPRVSVVQNDDIIANAPEIWFCFNFLNWSLEVPLRRNNFATFRVRFKWN